MGDFSEWFLRTQERRAYHVNMDSFKTDYDQTREVRCEATVIVHVKGAAPADWLSRVTTEDFPYRNWDGEPMSEAGGLKMLADNALRNGVDDASRLDGWGDLDRGVIELEVIDVEVFDE